MEKQAKQKLATAFLMFEEMGSMFLQFLNSNFKKRKTGTINSFTETTTRESLLNKRKK